MSFKRPTLPEVAINMLRAGLNKITSLKEAEKFILYHETAGWKVGKKAMVNWRGAAATWRKKIKLAAFDISAPREIATLQNIKSETDETAYRVIEHGKIFEFDLAHPPPDGTSYWLAWSNWKASPESYKVNR